jgi:modulator of FtsH protease
MLEQWSDFFVAAAGASAGLAGLIIVAMSVNIETIVKIPSMPSRAGSAIANLVLIVVASIAGLMAALPVQGFGIIVLVGALASLGFAVDSTVQMVRKAGASGLVRGAVSVLPGLGFLVGGALLVAGLGSGLYWVAAGILLAFVGSVVNAWVLLVEIRR